MTVHRIYVEKKEPYNVEASALKKDLLLFLGIGGLRSLRILNRYDVEGITKDLFLSCRSTIFSEPQVDVTYDAIPDDASFVFGVEYLPGQYDQRADSCAQCVQIVSQQERPLVRTARIYLLDGDLSKEERSKIKAYLINPVESREADLAEASTLKEVYPEPAPVEILSGFCTQEQDDLAMLLSALGLAMDLEDLTFCQSYFQEEGRDPSLTELRLIDTYWSDHCRHTTFLTEIEEAKIAGDDLWNAFRRYLDVKEFLGKGDAPVTLMDIATAGAKYLVKNGDLHGLDVSEEVNACSVRIPVDVNGTEESWLLMFKNETHNHPTEIEPFGGAATCIGGAIRDPLSGRSYVYQAMRVTGASNPLEDISMTLPGKLPQRKIVTTAAAGYSSYGNQIGLATGLVDELYHPGYVAKRMEVGAVIGAVPEANVVRQRPAPGDLVLLLGGKTGRDGCGGATGSSKSHDLSSLEKSGAEVQKGNAPEERKLQRLFRNAAVSKMIKRCNDFGAGGVSVAVGELSDGLRIDLDTIPKKYEGLDGTELAISESQERMAVVIAPEDLDIFLSHAKGENLEATVIASVTDTNRLQMTWRGRLLVDIARSFLSTNGAPKRASVSTPLPVDKIAGRMETSFDAILSSALEAMVTDLSVCSKQGLIERFDSTIGAGTVFLPLGGIHQETPMQAMAARLPVLGGETDTCSCMAYGFDPYLTEASPYLGSYLAVVSSVSRVIAVGGNRKHCYLSFQEYFEKLGNDPKRWGKPFAALLGALDAQLDLKIGAIGGKDSMSGSFEDIDVPPTLISFAVATGKMSALISPEWKQVDSRITLLAPDYLENGLPEPKSFLSCCDTVSRLIAEKGVLSVSSADSFGIAEPLFKNALGNRIGVALDSAVEIDDLFRLGHGAFLLESSEDLGVGKQIGRTIDSFEIRTAKETVDLMRLRSLYRSVLAPVFPTELEEEVQEYGKEHLVLPSLYVPSPKTCAPQNRLGKPLALIPVFPGTNCEYDTQEALRRSGAEAEIVVIQNLSSSQIAESVSAVAEKIRRSQIIVLPGGFSGGDEPDGSGKFITAFFRNPQISDAVRDLLQQRDGLILGICNGFQALIKLGLLPYGDITDPDPTAPTLTYNRIGRHQSRLVETRIASTLSPWLMDTKVGDIHTVAISHGEGRFVCEPDLLDALVAGGQIATQYVNRKGVPSQSTHENPNGSILAVEGLTSPDGRVFGKMGHLERYRAGLFQNVPGEKLQPIFTGAVRYFSL
ncbi:MAG: phosphoribosylformylglycinamidine synthase [Firmicutes bacterium HGW-Firmicutes-11]|nr:MAG: phosphoribosylformylglycinamidine synthase [Firmicutes bacterium HGW-Firmicutes-11]